jgi:hypothetical protein
MLKIGLKFKDVAGTHAKIEVNDVQAHLAWRAQRPICLSRWDTDWSDAFDNVPGVGHAAEGYFADCRALCSRYPAIKGRISLLIAWATWS